MDGTLGSKGVTLDRAGMIDIKGATKYQFYHLNHIGGTLLQWAFSRRGKIMDNKNDRITPVCSHSLL